MDELTNLTSLENTRGRTDRFSYQKGEYNGRPVFVKKANSPALHQNLESELQWAEFMRTVEKAVPNARLEGPHILDRPNKDALVFEFIDAPHLSDQNDLKPWRDNLDRYVDMLVTLDKLASDWQPLTTAYRSHPRSEQWVEKPVKWIGDNRKYRVPRLDEAVEILTKAQPRLKFCMQHGDLTPWQIFEKGEVWIIIDGEHSGTDLPRYNDLAYGYGRLSTILQSPETAKELLRKFIEKADVSIKEVERQLLPVMLASSLWMMGDALNDQPHNDYVQWATAYLERCLKMDLPALLEG